MSEHLEKFHSNQMPRWKSKTTAFMQVDVYQYLQKVVPSPRCLRQTNALVQGCWILLAASSQSWTREAWEPEGASSWPDLGSSNMHNEMLIGGKTQKSTIKQKHCSVLKMSLLFKLTQVFLFLPRYSNSSFRAMPLCEKHCWQIRAYLQQEWWDKLHGSRAPWCVLYFLL